MKKILLALFLCLNSFANDFNIEDRIKTQAFYLEVYPLLFGSPEIGLDQDFKKAFSKLKKKTRKQALKLTTVLELYLPVKVIKPIIYWKYINPNKKNLEKVLTFIMLNKLLILRDAIDDPIFHQKNLAKNLLKNLTGFNEISTNDLFEQVFPLLEDKSKLLVDLDKEHFSKAFSRTRLLTYNLKESVPAISSYSLSYLGFIPGNKVELVSENIRSLERIDWFNQRVIFNGGKLDFDSPYIHMPEEGSKKGNIVFVEDPIYKKIRTMIDMASESIFIDIFLFGGTLGATLSEYLLDQVIEKKKKNPDFKVLLLHDYATNYNMLGEMMPIFSYIKKRIETEDPLKGSVFLLQANIQRHPPGVPFGITNLIPKTDEVFKEIEKGNTYYESKIDHSKVIVIDANSKKPAAYFGSKNWTDHSGGYYYDDAIYVEGPAAALVQASYFRDVEAALTTDPKELRWFFYKEDGFDNKAYLPKREEILSWFKIKNKTYPRVGYETIRIAEACVDGRIKNVRNMLVDMIISAKKNIYMEQLFIYDKYIVDALIKKKIENPEIEIKILADHNGNFGMNGIPNTLFIKEMKDHGIEVRARKTYGIKAHFPNGHEQEYHQENHRKITSVDGKVLLGGSSNINPDTLQGSFREFGAQIYSEKEIEKFESSFLKAWNNPEEVADLDIENFQAKIGGKLFSQEMSALINDLGSFLIRNKDKLERRY